MFRAWYTQILIMIFTYALSKMSAAWGGGAPDAGPGNTAPTPTTGADPLAVSEDNPGLATIPADCTTTSNANFEAEVLRLINAERGKAEQKQLALNDALKRAARSQAMDLACNGKRMKNRAGDIGRGHTGSNGSTIEQRAAAVGYPGQVGEILAYRWPDPQGAVNAWLNSDQGHKENMLNPDWTEIGVAYVKRDDSIFTSYWAVVLGDANPSSPSSGGGGGTPASECIAIGRPDIETEVIQLINAERTKRGLAEFDTPAALTTAARSWASDKVCGKPYDSARSSWEALGYKLPQQGSSIPIWQTNENTQPMDINDATETAKQLIAHTEWLFSSEYTSIGVGCAQKSGTNEMYWRWIVTVRAASG